VTRGARTLLAFGAIVAIAALVVRFIVHDDAPKSVPPEPSGSRYPVLVEHHGVRGLSSGADSMVAVGDDGLILEKRGSSSWSEAPRVTHAGLRAVAQRLDEAIAVGDDGTLLERDVTAWKTVPSPTRRALRAVAFTSFGAVAVGDGGTIVRRTADDEPWVLETSSASGDLFGVCAGLRDVWIVGAAGTLVFRGPDGWTQASVVTPRTLLAVWCDDHAGIAVGEQGIALERLDDVPWHEVPSGTRADLFGVSSQFGARSWLAVGAKGTAIRLSGAPATEPTGIDWNLRAIAEGPLGTWLGGDDGLVQRR
jgi:hypothetical protein